MVDNIINVKILLSNGKNWVIPKQFIHSLQRKHDCFIIQLKDPKQHSYAQLLYSELENNKDLKVESFSVKRDTGEEEFPMYNTIEASTDEDKYTIKLIKNN